MTLMLFKMVDVQELCTLFLDEFAWIVLALAVILVSGKEGSLLRCIVVANALAVDITRVATLLLPGHHQIWSLLAFSMQFVLATISTVLYISKANEANGILLQWMVAVLYGVALLVAAIMKHIPVDYIASTIVVGFVIGAYAVAITQYCVRKGEERLSEKTI